ncbi:ABC transporter ATP-binding protein (plasmid) [Coraliomargarita sp. W4R53]
MNSTPHQRVSAVQLRGIVKRFGSFVANDDITIDVAAGSVHAIVGENGAGKSTLMKILSGELAPDAGEILVNAQREVFRSPRAAQRAGIGIVHQHFLLADAMRVWENVVLADEPGTMLALDRTLARERVQSIASENGFEIDVDAEIADLGVGDRQRVEILKVLYREARIIILDEPTAVLVPSEAAALFASARRLTANGAAVIFISHKLDEVLAFADEITVIRRGCVVGSTTPTQTSAGQLAALMVGGTMPVVSPRSAPPGKRVVLRANALSVGDPAKPSLVGVNLSVHDGEIVGVAGVEGNGQTELVGAILGTIKATGTVHLEDDELSGLSTRHRRARGISYVPEDRHRDGLVLDMPMYENAALGYVRRRAFSFAGWFRTRGASAAASEVIQRFDVRGATPRTLAKFLSGGNQQKFIIGRELMAAPRVLIAAHPTRGVDIGAQNAVWSELIAAREAGLATLLVSADLDELLVLSDRLLVMYEGQVVADLAPGTVTKNELGEYMTGVRTQQGGRES